MATILNNKINQDKDKDQVGQAPIMNAGGTAASTVGGAAPTAQNNNAKPVSSGRFANIQQFLGANKNAGQQVGGQVVKQQKDLSGKLTGAADASKQSVAGVGTEAEAFRKGTEVAKTIQNEQGDLGQFFDSYSNNETGPQFGNVNKDFTKLAQGQYDQSVIDKAGTDLNKTSSLLNDLSQFSGNLNTESGRQQLLRQAYQNKGNYGQGAGALDQAFLQRSGSPLIEQAQREIKLQGNTVDRSLNNLNKQYSANDALVKQLAGESSQAINSALTGSMSDFERAQVEQAQNLNTNRSKQQNLVNQFMNTGFANMSDQEKEAMNRILSEEKLTAGMNTYGLNLEGDAISSYSTRNRTDLSGKDVVDKNEFARIQALSRLSGKGPASYAGPTTDSLSESGIDIDSDRLLGDIQASRAGQTNTFSVNAADWARLYGDSPFGKANYSTTDLESIRDIFAKHNISPGGAVRSAIYTPAIQRDLAAAGYIKGLGKYGVDSDPSTSATGELYKALQRLQNTNYLGGKQ